MRSRSKKFRGKMATQLFSGLIVLTLVATNTVFGGEVLKPGSLIGQPCIEKNFRSFIDWGFQDRSDAKLKVDRLNDGLAALKVIQKHDWKPIENISENEKSVTDYILRDELPNDLIVALQQRRVSSDLPIFMFELFDHGIACFDGSIIALEKMEYSDSMQSFATALEEKYGKGKALGNFPAPAVDYSPVPYSRNISASVFPQPWGVVLLLKDTWTYVDNSKTPDTKTKIYYVDPSRISDIQKKVEDRSSILQERIQNEMKKQEQNRNQKLKDNI